MLRIFHYIITSEEETLTIGEYLRNRRYSHHILAHLKRTPGGILQNGVSVPVSRRLQAGDCLEIHLAEEAPSENITPTPMELNIVYEDEDLLIINKSADTPIHPSINNHENTLANGIAWYYRQQNLPFVYRCINRLDRDTSGLLIIAKNMLSASILSAELKQRNIHRTYLAVAEGRIEKGGTVDAPIAREEGSALKRCINFETGERAVTHYEPLHYQENLDLTLLSLRLETGRTHQIRVHMGYLGHPLIGDFLYYPRRDLIDRQALHSWKLDFVHPITGAAMHFEAELPKDMAQIGKNFSKR